MQEQTIFCNNCGDKGHPFRDCKKPVLSCGILLLRDKNLPVKSSDVELLMVRRKDSMSYTEFMRGKYDPTNREYVVCLLENMTKQELSSLKTQPFDSLWSKMWNYNEHELTVTRDKYTAVKDLVQSCVTSYSEPEWGFPKGRRYRTESDLQCAEREFWEETNIPRSSYILVKNVVFNETFVGTNGVPYEHKYFLCVLTQPFVQQKLTTMQKREISSVQWKSIPECMSHTRPHYTERTKLLKELIEFVSVVELRSPNITDKDNGNLGT
jgi:8-oxo-dGTP pyrophosphatase MutT (NUDIX family)